MGVGMGWDELVPVQIPPSIVCFRLVWSALLPTSRCYSYKSELDRETDHAEPTSTKGHV